MKKSTVLRMIAMLLALLLAGCSSSTASSPGDENTTPPAPTTTAQQPAVTTPVTTSAHSADNWQTDPLPEWLSTEQRNALSMLNYLAMTTQDIHSSSNSRVLLEEIYTCLINEINPGSVDKETKDYLDNIRAVIREFLHIETKREQLQYIYNREMAAAVRAAVPNPLLVLAMTDSMAGSIAGTMAGSPDATMDWGRLAVSVTFTMLDSYTNYQDAVDNAEHNYFLSGWELDAEEQDVILRNRGATFNYMTEMVQKHGKTEENKTQLGKLTLNEKAIEAFVEICSEENITLRTERLVNARETYQFFGNYWLELADCYFQMEKYEQCLNCLAKYDELDIRIFRQDFNVVPILPKAIVSAQNVYSGEEYVQTAKALADRILENTGADDWSVRYFAAQTYLDLYAKTKDKTYLQTAYQIVKRNVTELIGEQKELNETYLADVQKIALTEKQEKSLSTDAKKQEQKRIDEYNKALKKTRETELPPIYEPLALNCELLFALAEELGIDEAERNNIAALLESEACGVFLSKPVNNMYSFTPVAMEGDMVFKKGSVAVPVTLLSPTATVKVTVTEGDKTTIFEDFVISKVTRGGGLETFQAVFKSKKMGNYNWTKKSVITVELINEGYCEPVTMQFKVKKIETHLFSDDTVTFEKYEAEN